MALISDATIIIEASANSGTRYQAMEALRLGRTLENILQDIRISWAKELLDQCARMMTKTNYQDLIKNIRHRASKKGLP